MTKLERLQKKAVDTAADNAGRAYVAWSNADRDLNNYLKEQDNE